MQKRIEALEKTSRQLIDYMQDSRGNISAGFEKVNSNFEKITAHLQKIDKDIKTLSAQLEQLNGSTNNGFGDVNVKLEDLKVEITKINDVTGYEGIFTNLKKNRVVSFNYAVA